MTTAAYAMLGDTWYDCPVNLWPYGDVASDDALKGGSGTTDTGYHPMEIWSTMTETPGEFDALWYNLYRAISRCNRALVSLEDNGEASLGKETTAIRIGEVKFLRSHFYFKLITMFGQVPWIDEQVFRNSEHESVRNDVYTFEQLMLKVIDDLKEAYDILPETQQDGGRVNKIAAASYLAKCYLTIAWGNGYEDATGEGFVNQDYMN